MPTEYYFPPRKHVTIWASGGIERTVTTLQEANQSVAAWNAAHLAAVTKAFSEFPPD